jgi:hypothetical protein
VGEEPLELVRERDVSNTGLEVEPDVVEVHRSSVHGDNPRADGRDLSSHKPLSPGVGSLAYEVHAKRLLDP